MKVNLWSTCLLGNSSRESVEAGAPLRAEAPPRTPARLAVSCTHSRMTLPVAESATS